LIVQVLVEALHRPSIGVLVNQNFVLTEFLLTRLHCIYEYQRNHNFPFTTPKSISLASLTHQRNNIFISIMLALVFYFSKSAEVRILKLIFAMTSYLCPRRLYEVAIHSWAASRSWVRGDSTPHRI